MTENDAGKMHVLVELAFVGRTGQTVGRTEGPSQKLEKCENTLGIAGQTGDPNIVHVYYWVVPVGSPVRLTIRLRNWTLD